MTDTFNALIDAPSAQTEAPHAQDDWLFQRFGANPNIGQLACSHHQLDVVPHQKCPHISANTTSKNLNNLYTGLLRKFPFLLRFQGSNSSREIYLRKPEEVMHVRLVS